MIKIIKLISSLASISSIAFASYTFYQFKQGKNPLKNLPFEISSLLPQEVQNEDVEKQMERFQPNQLVKTYDPKTMSMNLSKEMKNKMQKKVENSGVENDIKTLTNAHEARREAFKKVQKLMNIQSTPDK